MKYTETTAARLISSMIRAIPDTRAMLQRAWIDGQRRMCACDGFRAYRINKPVAGVPTAEKEPFDLNKIMPAVDESKELTLPTLSDVRAMIAEDNRRRKEGTMKKNLQYCFTFGTNERGEQLPAVNLKYLADMIQMFPTARAFMTSVYGPIIFRDENGEGALLPMRVNGAPGIDVTKRRQAPASVKKTHTAPALSPETFLALYC